MKLDPMLDMKIGEQAIEYGEKTKPQPLESQIFDIDGISKMHPQIGTFDNT
jgi:hypothetical protein